MIAWLALAALVAWSLFWAGYARGRATAPKPLIPVPGRLLVELELVDAPGKVVPVAHPRAGDPGILGRWITHAARAGYGALTTPPPPRHTWEHRPELRAENDGEGACNTGSGKRDGAGHPIRCSLGGIGCDVDHHAVRAALQPPRPPAPGPPAAPRPPRHRPVS